MASVYFHIYICFYEQTERKLVRLFLTFYFKMEVWVRILYLSNYDTNFDFVFKQVAPYLMILLLIYVIITFK